MKEDCIHFKKFWTSRATHNLLYTSVHFCIFLYVSVCFYIFLYLADYGICDTISLEKE